MSSKARYVKQGWLLAARRHTASWHIAAGSHYLFWEGQGVSSALVVDGDEALFNVNVGGAVLSHGAQLHQVALWCQLLHQPPAELCALLMRSSDSSICVMHSQEANYMPNRCKDCTRPASTGCRTRPS